MKMKKVVALFLSAVMTMSLVACGGTKTEADNKKQNDDVQESQESSLDWSAGADASGGEVTLRFSTWRTEDEEYLQTLIDKFEEKYDWINVEMTIDSNANSYYQNMQADFLSDSAVDVMHIHAAAYLKDYALEGYLAPQTDFDYMENYDETALAASSIDGVNYGFITNYNYTGFIYNKDIFAKVGVDVPTTPDELIDVVGKLKAAGYGGVLVAGKTFGSAYGRAVLMNAIGGDGYNELRAGLDDGSITDVTQYDGVTEALDTMQAYSDNNIYYDAYTGTDATAAYSLFAQEKTAIIYGGTYLFGEQDLRFPGINAGFFPVPTYANTGYTYAETGETLVVNAAGKNLGAAKLFVEFMAEPENVGYLNESSMKLSTIKGVEWNFEEIQTYVKGYALMYPITFKNEDYWSTGLSNMLKGVTMEGKSWKDMNKVYKSQLEEYDLANQ